MTIDHGKDNRSTTDNGPTTATIVYRLGGATIKAWMRQKVDRLENLLFFQKRQNGMASYSRVKTDRAMTTSSSAVAKRPRDASCLSVVSFNSTKRRVESFIVSYV